MCSPSTHQRVPLRVTGHQQTPEVKHRRRPLTQAEASVAINASGRSVKGISVCLISSSQAGREGRSVQLVYADSLLVADAPGDGSPCKQTS